MDPDHNIGTRKPFLTWLSHLLRSLLTFFNEQRFPYRVFAVGNPLDHCNALRYNYGPHDAHFLKFPAVLHLPPGPSLAV